MGYWLQRQTRIWWNTFTDKGKRNRYSTLTQLLYSVWQQTCCPTTNSKHWHRTSGETQQTNWWNPVPIQETESRSEMITIIRKDPTAGHQSGKKTLSIKSVLKKIMKLTKEDLKSERQKDITGRTIETWTNRYKDHHKYKYETVIASSGSVWTIIIQINFIKQYKM